MLVRGPHASPSIEELGACICPSQVCAHNVLFIICVCQWVNSRKLFTYAMEEEEGRTR